MGSGNIKSCYKSEIGLQYIYMTAIKIHSKQVSVYCNDLEKTINRDGCYDAKGSTICKACSVKLASKKIIKVNKDK